eukprot:gene20776-27600_t
MAGQATLDHEGRGQAELATQDRTGWGPAMLVGWGQAELAQLQTVRGSGRSHSEGWREGWGRNSFVRMGSGKPEVPVFASSHGLYTDVGDGGEEYAPRVANIQASYQGPGFDHERFDHAERGRYSLSGRRPGTPGNAAERIFVS